MPQTRQDKLQTYPFPLQDFLAHDLEAGSAYFCDGQRMVLAGEDMILACFQVLEEVLNGMSIPMMYQIGLEWGTRQYDHTERFILEYFPSYGSIQDMPLSLFVDLCNRLLVTSGWGTITLKEHFGWAFVDLTSTCCCSLVGMEGNPVCYLYAGFFAGLFSRAAGQELGCVEVSCSSFGDESCRFLLDSPEVTEVVSDWIQSGMPTELVMRNMRDLG